MRCITVSLLISSTFRMAFCRGSGGRDGTLQADGATRGYIVYAPASGLQQHTLGGTGSQFRSMSGWNALLTSRPGPCR